MASKAYPPASARLHETKPEDLICLELEDGLAFQGYSFGARKSVAGELVFQTGMVGYPESVTDPSYRGQILVITFPLVGNYGVPSRETMDELLGDLPAHFEASQIHIAGLVAASYSGEDYSHYLASSSLGTWLKEQGIPAMYGVDTRALTKHIREKGSMLGRMLLFNQQTTNGTNGVVSRNGGVQAMKEWKPYFDTIDWVNPNETNLVAEGKSFRNMTETDVTLLTSPSVHQGTKAIHSARRHCRETSFGPHDSNSLPRCRYEIQPAPLLSQTRRRSACLSLGP